MNLADIGCLVADVLRHLGAGVAKLSVMRAYFTGFAFPVQICVALGLLVLFMGILFVLIPTPTHIDDKCPRLLRRLIAPTHFVFVLFWWPIALGVSILATVRDGGISRADNSCWLLCVLVGLGFVFVFPRHLLLAARWVSWAFSPKTLTKLEPLPFQKAPRDNLVSQIRSASWDSGTLLSVEGDWGSGKSTMMALLEAELALSSGTRKQSEISLDVDGRSKGAPDTPSSLRAAPVKDSRSKTAYVYFNVWRHESDPDLELSLVSHIFGSEYVSRCWRFLPLLGPSPVISWISKLTFTAKAVNLQIVLDKPVRPPWIRWHSKFDLIGGLMKSRDTHLVVVFDEIDRCCPVLAQSALTLSRRLMEIPGLVVVIPYVGSAMRFIAFHPTQLQLSDLKGTGDGILNSICETPTFEAVSPALDRAAPGLGDRYHEVLAAAFLPMDSDHKVTRYYRPMEGKYLSAHSAKLAAVRPDDMLDLLRNATDVKSLLVNGLLPVGGENNLGTVYLKLVSRGIRDSKQRTIRECIERITYWLTLEGSSNPGNERGNPQRTGLQLMDIAAAESELFVSDSDENGNLGKDGYWFQRPLDLQGGRAACRLWTIQWLAVYWRLAQVLEVQKPLLELCSIVIGLLSSLVAKSTGGVPGNPDGNDPRDGGSVGGAARAVLEELARSASQLRLPELGRVENALQEGYRLLVSADYILTLQPEASRFGDDTARSAVTSLKMAGLFVDEASAALLITVEELRRLSIRALVITPSNRIEYSYLKQMAGPEYDDENVSKRLWFGGKGKGADIGLEFAVENVSSELGDRFSELAYCPNFPIRGFSYADLSGFHIALGRVVVDFLSKQQVISKECEIFIAEVRQRISEAKRAFTSSPGKTVHFGTTLLDGLEIDQQKYPDVVSKIASGRPVGSIEGAIEFARLFSRSRVVCTDVKGSYLADHCRAFIRMLACLSSQDGNREADPSYVLDSLVAFRNTVATIQTVGGRGLDADRRRALELVKASVGMSILLSRPSVNIEIGRLATPDSRLWGGTLLSTWHDGPKMAKLDALVLRFGDSNPANDGVFASAAYVMLLQSLSIVMGKSPAIPLLWLSRLVGLPSQSRATIPESAQLHAQAISALVLVQLLQLENVLGSGRHSTALTVGGGLTFRKYSIEGLILLSRAMSRMPGFVNESNQGSDIERALSKYAIECASTITSELEFRTDREAAFAAIDQAKYELGKYHSEDVRHIRDFSFEAVRAHVGDLVQRLTDPHFATVEMRPVSATLPLEERGPVDFVLKVNETQDDGFVATTERELAKAMGENWSGIVALRGENKWIAALTQLIASVNHFVAVALPTNDGGTVDDEPASLDFLLDLWQRQQ